MMQTGEGGIALIKKYEVGPNLKTFAAYPYKCPAGYVTVGWGHVVKPQDKFQYPLSAEQAEAILRSDLKWAEEAVNKSVKRPLTQNQFDACVSLTFNIGAGGFSRSSIVRLINEGKMSEAADFFLRYRYAGGKELKGLRIRREQERTLFLS